MEIMLLGSDRAALDATEATLVRAGHSVHRCAPTPSASTDGAICVGALDAALCPLSTPLDVALVVESGPAVDGLEPIGVGCAVRDQVPMASMRPDEDPLAAVTATLEARDANWADALNTMLDRDDLRFHSERQGVTLHVTVSGNITNDAAEAARLSSRVYDLVRDRVPSGIRSVGVGVSPS